MSKLSKISNWAYALSTLSGTIIGVGLFSLPYITSKVGVGIMLEYFLILGGLVILIHYLFGQVALRTPDFMRLPGYAKLYLGKWGKRIAFISTILGILGAILAYLIVGGEFLANLLTPIFGGNATFYTIIYFIIGALLIFFGIKAISRIEFWGLVLFFVILIIIFSNGHHLITVGNLLSGKCSLNFMNLFLPYGPILFSLWGVSTIPQIEEMLENKKNLLKVIIISLLISVFVYLFFIYLVLGITGSETSESAIAGLKGFLGERIISLGFIFGILATFTSFVSLGLTLKKVFCYDLKIKKEISWLITCFPPLILFLIGVKSFIPVISFVGGVMIGIEGVLILLMYLKITKNKVLTVPLTFVLLGGIIYEIVYFLK